jgi:hypothetical protein
LAIVYFDKELQMKPHKHAELIKAWADGAEIQYKLNGVWYDGFHDMSWLDNYEYRIKPEPKPDVYTTHHFWYDFEFKECQLLMDSDVPNLKLTFDGETGELKSAEVLK